MRGYKKIALTIAFLALPCATIAEDGPPADNLSHAKITFWIFGGALTILSAGFGLYFTRDMAKQDRDKELQREEASRVSDDITRLGEHMHALSERVGRIESSREGEPAKMRADLEDHRRLHERIDKVETDNTQHEKEIARIQTRCLEREKAGLRG